MGCEPGDELVIRVFYQDKHAEEAAASALEWPQLPSMAELAAELPMPSKPLWLAEVWPRRRNPWRWGEAVDLPSVDHSLELIENLVRANTSTDWGATAEDLRRLEKLGVPEPLIELHRRVGSVRSDNEAHTLYVLGAGLLSITDSFQVRDLEAELASRARVWRPSFLTVLRGPDFADLLVSTWRGSMRDRSTSERWKAS